MKKLLLSALAIGLAFTCTAQLRTLTKSADTASDAATIYLTTPAQGYMPITTFQLNVVKVSGTVAGTAIVQGSLDGTNYSTISTDTLTLTNASQSKAWAIGTSQYLYYRIKYTTSGTQKSVPSAMVLFRKP